MDQILLSAIAGLSILVGGVQTRVCQPVLNFLGLSSWISLSPEEANERCYFLNRVHWRSSSTVSSYSIAIVPSSDLQQWIICDITNLDVIDPNVLRDKQSQRFIACWDISRMSPNETAREYKDRLFAERRDILEMHNLYPLRNARKDMQ
jgi:hypothetical protein